MKTNYQAELDLELEKITKSGKIPRLLLHACCAPCSSYVLEYLTKYFNIDVFFLNSNIISRNEYELRLQELRRLCDILPRTGEIKLIEGKYDPEEYLSTVKGLENEPEGGARCTVCLGNRIDATANLAAEGRYDYFATTLTVSPHKNAELINSLGYAAAERHGAVWLPSDFKKRGGYLRSTELCREYNIWRQNYCGCGLGI